MTQICARHGCRKTALRKFCSNACRIAHHNGLRPPASKVKVTCQGCGKAFQGRPDQKTCGATCRSRLFRAKKRSDTGVLTDLTPSAVDWGRSTPYSPASYASACRSSNWKRGWSSAGCRQRPNPSACGAHATVRISSNWILGSARPRPRKMSPDVSPETGQRLALGACCLRYTASKVSAKRTTSPKGSFSPVTRHP